MTTCEILTAAVKKMIECAQEPGEWRVGKDAYYELMKLDYFVQGSPPTIYGIPIVYDEFAKPDMVYLISRQMVEISSQSIKKMPGKKITLPKWKPPRRKRKKEWWE